MKLLRFLVGLAIATALRALSLRYLPTAAQWVDPFLILVLYQSLDLRPTWSMLGGCVAGLAQDALSGGHFGLFGFADTLVAYLSARLTQRFVIQQPVQVLLLFAIAAALQQTILAALQFLLVPGGELARIEAVAGTMVSTAVVGTGLSAFADRLQAWDHHRRSERRQRLRIGTPRGGSL